MDVILLKNLDNLGDIGETVSVARGYARNYLLPKGLAVEASDGAMNMVADKVRIEQKRDLKRKEAAEAVKAQYEGKELALKMTAQAGDEDQLYGSISARDIAAELAKQSFELEARQVHLDEPIKHLGEFEVPVKLHPEVTILVKVTVERA